MDANLYFGVAALVLLATVIYVVANLPSQPKICNPNATSVVYQHILQLQVPVDDERLGMEVDKGRDQLCEKGLEYGRS